MKAWQAAVFVGLILLLGIGSIVYLFQRHRAEHLSRVTEETVSPAKLGGGSSADADGLSRGESAEGGDGRGSTMAAKRASGPGGDVRPSPQSGYASRGEAQGAPVVADRMTSPISMRSGLPGGQSGSRPSRAGGPLPGLQASTMGTSTMGSGSTPVGTGQPGAPQVVPFDPNAPAGPSGTEGRFTAESRVQVAEAGTISGESGTVSFIVEPQWAPENQRDVSLIEIGEGQVVIRKNVSYLRLEMTDITGAPVGTGFNIQNWEPGKAHHVAATWGDGVMTLYVDGKPAARERYKNAFSLPPGTPLYIGNAAQRAPVAGGYVKGIVLSDHPLSAGSVGNLAALMLPQPPPQPNK